MLPHKTDDRPALEGSGEMLLGIIDKVLRIRVPPATPYAALNLNVSFPLKGDMSYVVSHIDSKRENCEKHECFEIARVVHSCK